MFRFEYLWPFWLLVRSIYDSFKYQGLVSLIGLTNIFDFEIFTTYRRSQYSSSASP